jgi:hypothetical protein
MFLVHTNANDSCSGQFEELILGILRLSNVFHILPIPSLVNELNKVVDLGSFFIL